MKDYIDERNFREKMAKSIIKRRNVIYISREELERKKKLEEERLKQKGEEERPEDILKRLEEAEREAERKMQAEIEKMKLERDLDRILGEKDRDLKRTIESTYTDK